jgi:hypothetical protein
MADVKKTITSVFIVPTLGVSRENLTNNGFINGYIQDSRKDIQYEYCIYLLFKPEKLSLFREFLDEEYERTKSVIDDYDYEDGYVVIVYQLDKKFKKDIGLVKEGRYSKTSKEFQELFPKVVKVKRNGLHKDEISLQYRVFNKTEDLKKYWEDKLAVEFDDDMEVWEGFIFDNEILNLDKIKEKCTTKQS